MLFIVKSFFKVYKHGIGNGSLKGYVNYTLSIKSVDDIQNPPLDHEIFQCK